MTTPTTELPAEMNIFLEKMIEEAHGDQINTELKDDMKQDLFARMQNHVITSLLQALPNDSAEAFHTLMEKGPDETEVHNFFIAHVPNLPEVTARAMMEFRTVYVGKSKS